MVATGLLAPKKKSYIVRISPPMVMVFANIMCILIGAALLMLPQASYTGTSFIDALFTACASVTVTGLMTLDAGTHFTFLGQFIILCLIQLGGLGLMAFAILIMAILGMRTHVGREVLLRDNVNETDLRHLVRLVYEIFKFVLVMEIVGALLLATHFVPAFGFTQGMWHSIFHTVSAFNNAGISLFSNGLTPWAGSPIINCVIPLLIITGGIGYTVIADMNEKRRWHKLNLHSKLMLSGSAALIAFGMILFALLEWNNPATLGGLQDDGARLMASWFQSVTTRTAGFATVDIGALYDSTSFMMMPLMIIGGGGSSTAGGIKVTTFIVMLLAVIAFFKQRDHLQAFGRSMGMETVLKAMAIITVSMATVLCGIFIMSIGRETMSFLDIVFETTAAFSTAGLSRGVTAEFDYIGKLTLMVLMCLGKFGPLAFSFFISTRAVSRVRYPPSDVFLG